MLLAQSVVCEDKSKKRILFAKNAICEILFHKSAISHIAS